MPVKVIPAVLELAVIPVVAAAVAPVVTNNEAATPPDVTPGIPAGDMNVA